METIVALNEVVNKNWIGYRYVMQQNTQRIKIELNARTHPVQLTISGPSNAKGSFSSGWDWSR